MPLRRLLKGPQYGYLSGSQAQVGTGHLLEWCSIPTCFVLHPTSGLWPLNMGFVQDMCVVLTLCICVCVPYSCPSFWHLHSDHDFLSLQPLACLGLWHLTSILTWWYGMSTLLSMTSRSPQFSPWLQWPTPPLSHLGRYVCESENLWLWKNSEAQKCFCSSGAHVPCPM